MAFLCCVLLLLLQLSSSSFASSLQYAEQNALFQLKSILEFPHSIANWSAQMDFCSIPASQTLTIICESGYVTHLQILGNRGSSSSKNKDGMLSSSFSSESLVVHLTNFSRLKVLQLNSLGIWGPLPSKLGRLTYLEVLNMSSNFLWGVLPNRLLSLQNLQLLALDDNMLNGSLPQKWGALYQLSSLSLTSNKLQGQLPSSLFSQLPSLKSLVLDDNLLSGSVPISLSNALNLQSLSLARNSLSGNLPDLRGLPNLLALNLQDNQIGPGFPLLAPQLLYLALGKNKLQGRIPSYITYLSQLQQLDLSSNLLSGVPPSSFFTLPNIKFLNVARNRLSGSLPSNLTISSSMQMLDFSFNLLTGHVPMEMAALVARRGAAAIRFEWNCLFTSLQPQNPFTYCQNAALASTINPHLSSNHDTSSKSMRVGILVGIAAGVLAIALVAVLLLFIIIHRKRPQSGEVLKSATGGPCMGNKAVSISSELLANARYISKTLKLGALGLPQFRVFSMDELYNATDFFHESTLLGEGIRGKVYKGQLDDGSLVAIKRLRKERVSNMKNVKARIERLAKFRHQHLVSLLGYNLVTEGDNENQGAAQVYLIYEYVSNRTLQTRLAGKGQDRQDGFGWLQRLLAIIGAAKGIHFLHSGLVPGIFNNDIKIRNILLDQNFVSKVSDYGLVSPLDATEDIDKRSPITNSFSPAENHSRKKLLDKVDVYNFGLVLLEVLVGKPLSSHGGSDRPQVLETFVAEQGSRVEVVDPKILGSCNMESLETVMEITAKCLLPDALSRPSMEDVLWNLQYALQVQDSSNGGSQEDFVDGLYSSEMHTMKGRKNINSAGKVSTNDEVGKPSSPNADFFR